MNSSMQLCDQLSVKVVTADALDARAADFYRKNGFREVADNARVSYLPLGKG